MTTSTVPACAVTRHTIALPFDWRAPASARRVAARWLDDLQGRPGRTADAVLVVSELVTNAVRHTRGPCELTLTLHGTLLDIAVADQSEELPQTSWESPIDEPGGLGFPLIRALGGRVKVVPALGGKTVHVVFDLDSGAGHRAGVGRQATNETLVDHPFRTGRSFTRLPPRPDRLTR
ncbi:ATP-binding protein [Streptomyces sp. NPDC048018]|uniref:ATP-binding protein n=1 Tax=Streptomyces sp. NPDC048018 TaxID=3365499 RepID=UPI00371918A8